MSSAVQPAAPSPPSQPATVEQASARYEGLIALWSHRDATMHQWPPLIITATAAILALILSQKRSDELKLLVDPSHWGDPGQYSVWLGTGIPLLVGGITVLPFIYGMTRAITIMDAMAAEIADIETHSLACPASATFKHLNHPGGWSSRKLIRRTMITIATGLVLFGSLFVAGIIFGWLLFAIIMGTSLLYLKSDKLK